MSEKEKKIVEGIAKLPGPMKDRFLDKIEGAVMALDMLAPQKGEQNEPREKRVPGHAGSAE